MKRFNLIFGLFLLAIVVAIHYLADSTTAGITLATGAGLYTEDMEVYRRLLEKRMQTVAWNISFWTNFLGFIGGKKSMFDPVQPHGVKGKQTATGAPIEVLQNFRYDGGLDMDIPIFYPLTGKGISGSLYLKGKGEKPKFNVLKVGINQQRHAYLVQDNKVSKQILQNPGMVAQLMRKANEYLGDWFRRWNAYQPYLAFLEGYSENLSKTALNGGRAKSKASHMNIYTAGGGKVAFSNTKATYEAAVKAAINGLTNTSTDYMSTDVIENLVYVASHSHKVQPLTIGGVSDLYPIVISDAQAKQLQADADWLDAQNLAENRGILTNARFTGRVAGVYGGGFLIVDPTIPSFYTDSDGEYSNARSTTGDANGVCIGTQDADGDPDFMANPVDPGNKKPAILFGKSALACGVANDLSFEEELDDFKQRQEIGADMMVGFQRSDILDKDGYFGTSGDYRYENVSSVVAVTYSPSDASW